MKVSLSRKKHRVVAAVFVLLGAFLAVATFAQSRHLQ